MSPDPETPLASLGVPCRFAASLLLLMVRYSCTQGEEIDAVAFQLLAPPAMRGNLSSNNILLNAERLHSGQINSPHSYVALGDDMYTATASGLIVNVAACRPVVIANLRPRGCRSPQECGHLVSIRLNKDNLLIVLDAYRGVFEVHPVTGVIRHLYDSRTLVSGRPTIYLNDLVILADGTIIMSDSSSRFNYDNEFWIRFEGRPDGRLIGFSPANGQSKEILSGLAYPTGLEITYSGQALLVSEASRARILRLELDKTKFFQRSYVNINLPGMPEHIRKSGQGTYWVGLTYPRHRGEISFLDQYSSKPASRNFLAIRRTMNELRFMYKSRGLAVELDEVGKILRSIHDLSGEKVREVLEVTDYSGVLYVGTRTQQATVRVVGSPNELKVESLVQVLRGRCKVTEDKVQATKESIEQQLKGNQTKGPTKSTATIQQYTSPPNHTIPSDSEAFKTQKPKKMVDLKALSQSLSKLHRTLLNATSNIKKSSPATHTVPQVVQQDVTSNPQEATPPPPKEYIPVQQDTTALNTIQVNTQYNSRNTTVPFEDPFLPPPSPQNTIPPQNAAEISTVHVIQHNISSSNEPHLKHTFLAGQLTSHVILSPKEQELLTGYLTRRNQLDQPYSDLPNEPSSLRANKDTQENISPTISFNKPTAQHTTELQQQIVTLRPTIDPVTQPHPLPETTELGGFMGFLSISRFQNGALVNSNDQTTPRNPYLFSVPDPELFGQIEPVLGTNPGASSQTHQFLPGMESFVSFEQLTSPNDQTPSNVEQILVNQSQTTQSQSISQAPANSYKFESHKRPDMSVQDISIKDATAIQNMQMFHPTDRPDQLAQLQNQAGAKTVPSYHEKTPPTNHEVPQLQGGPFDPQQKEVYTTARSSQLPHGRHNEAQQNTQYVNTFEQGRPSSFQPGSAMTVPSYHEKTSPTNHEVPQLQGGPFDPQPKEVYTTARSSQLPHGRHNEAQQNTQNMNTFGQGRPSSFQPGSAMIDMSQGMHVSSNTQIESFDPGAPLHQGSAGNIYDHSAII